MTQNNNSLLPDGYHFWSDDNSVAEPKAEKVIQKIDPGEDLNRTSETEREAQSLSVSDSEIEPVEVPNVVTDESELSLMSDSNSETFASDKFGNQENLQPISVQFTTAYTNRPRITKPESPSAATTSVLADFWLSSLQQSGKPEGSAVAAEWAQHSPDNHGWSGAPSVSQEPAAYWRCDSSGTVVWFLDQNGIGWAKNLSHEDVYCSEDGGERAAVACLTTDGCWVEDSDGTILTITHDGRFAIENRRKSREQNVRSLLDVFCGVDANRDERLSLAEIESALKNCNEKDRPLINSLRTHFKRIEWSRRGMFGQVAEGLSLREILDLTSNGGRSSEHDIDETLLSQIEAVIDFIDPNRCGFVDRDGLERALRDLIMPGRLRRSMEVLVRRLKELSLFSAYGFSSTWQPTRQAIRLMLCDLYKQSSYTETVDMPGWASLEICADLDRGLYATENDPLSSITIDAIKNCAEAHQCFMSVVTAMIVHAPELILRTLRRSDNGAFVVTFIGDRNTPIRVLLPAQKEIHEYGLAPEHGVWALVLARGFAQYLEQKTVTEQPFSAPHEIAELLIGNEVSCLPLKEQCSNELAKLIDRLWAQDRMMLLCRFPHDDQDISTSVLKHSGAITGWDPQSGVVSLANPQSQMPEQISIDVLQTCFDSLLYSS